MLVLKRLDFLFIVVILLGVFLYIILTSLNILRFESLNSLSFSPGTHEQVFRWLLQLPHDPVDFIYSTKQFPPPEFFVEPLVLIGSLVFHFLFWLLNSCLGVAVPYATLLLFSQPLFFIISGIVLYKLALTILGDRYLAFAITISFLLNQLVFIGSAMGFIFFCIGTPLLLSEFYCVFNKRPMSLIFFLFLANTTRIDVILMNSIFGLSLMIWPYDHDYRRYGKHIFIISIIWLALLMFYFVPHITVIQAEGHRYAATFKDSFFYLFKNPYDIFIFFRNLHFSGVFMVYIVHVAFMPLLAAQFMLPVLGTLPILFFRFASAGFFLNLAFVYLAAIFGLKRLFTRYHSLPLRRYVGILIIICACLSHYLYHFSYIDSSVGIIPFSQGFSFERNKPTPRSKLGYCILKTIPRGARCFTINPLAQRLGHLRRVGVYGRTPLTDITAWEYYFFSFKELDFISANFNFTAYLRMVQDILNTGQYNVEIYKDGWLLLRRAPARDVDANKVRTVLKDIANLVQ